MFARAVMMDIDIEKIDIRQASSVDFHILSVLATTTFYEAYFEQDDPSDLADYIVDSFAPVSMQEQLSDPEAIFFIVSIAGHAVGFAKLLLRSIDASISTENTVELKRIYILERVWGTGVGEALLQHCEEFAKELGNESIWLGVWQLNERGQRFYAKHGFVKTGIITFPYGESVGINDVMEKKL